ncbi:PAS domain-containing sensor histidine kinase [Nitrincola schmidtii]|uniref:PAS domain-containing sensor histidine kinase n=1 Tax=Nitrincola schmidtii TaxID=1730894 RepID=UPI00124C7B92|nr:ATP-binding protein [Nitrincola schmidtii]
MIDLQQELERCQQEADRYRLLAEQSTDLISRHTATSEWIFIDVNPAIEPLLGYRAEEIIGTSGYALFHPEDADNLKNRTDSVRYRDGLYTNVYRYRHKQGHYIWFETTSRTIRDDKGIPVEVICVSRDVTERERALQATRRLAKVVEASSDMILFCQHNNLVLTYLNESAQRTLNNASSSPKRRLPNLFNETQFMEAVIPALNLAAKQGYWHGAISMELDDESERVAELREVIAHRDRNNRHNVDYYTLIGRDVTVRKLAEQQYKRHQNEMAHMSRLLSVGEMATELAHEINQPLATILNYSNGTLRQIEEQQIKEISQTRRALELISKQAHRAAEIIRRIRRFVQRTEIQYAPFDINDCCQEVVTFLNQDARDQQISFQFDLDPASPFAYGDRVQVEQVLLNLLKNSIEAYASHSCSSPSIQIKTFTEGQQVIVSVKDQAGGIKPDIMTQLFEPFMTSKSNGLGMGLSISRSLIESHGGQLWAESDGHKQSCFYFKLPLRNDT